LVQKSYLFYGYHGCYFLGASCMKRYILGEKKRNADTEKVQKIPYEQGEHQ
jgi:hypothetical protein